MFLQFDQTPSGGSLSPRTLASISDVGLNVGQKTRVTEEHTRHQNLQQIVHEMVKEESQGAQGILSDACQ